MSRDQAEYTQGEIKALIAPIFGISADNINEFMISVKGYCDQCGAVDHIRVAHNMIIPGHVP